MQLIQGDVQCPGFSWFMFTPLTPLTKDMSTIHPRVTSSTLRRHSYCLRSPPCMTQLQTIYGHFRTSDLGAEKNHRSSTHVYISLGKGWREVAKHAIAMVDCSMCYWNHSEPGDWAVPGVEILLTLAQSNMTSQEIPCQLKHHPKIGTVPLPCDSCRASPMFCFERLRFFQNSR